QRAGRVKGGSSSHARLRQPDCKIIPESPRALLVFRRALPGQGVRGAPPRSTSFRPDFDRAFSVARQPGGGRYGPRPVYPSILYPVKPREKVTAAAPKSAQGPLSLRLGRVPGRVGSRPWGQAGSPSSARERPGEAPLREG